MKHTFQLILWVLVAVLLLSTFAACSDKNDPVSVDSSVLSTQSASSETEIESNNTDSDSSKNGTSSKADSTAQNSSATSSTAQSSDISSQPQPENAPTVFLDAKKDGDIVTVTASVKNNTGLAGFGFKISYEQSKVAPVEVKKGLVTVVSNLQQSTQCNGEVTAIYSDAAGFSDNGVLFTVTFKVTDQKATEATFKILAESNSFVDCDAKYTTFTTTDTTVKF